MKYEVTQTVNTPKPAEPTCFTAEHIAEVIYSDRGKIVRRIKRPSK